MPTCVDDEPTEGADFTLRRSRSEPFLLAPNTTVAHDWLLDMAPEGAVFHEGALVVERRYLADVIAAVRDDGLTLEWEEGRA